jgi:hypothetical protein
MFFNTKKKTAQNIAAAVANTYRPSFMWTSYLNRETGEFNPPAGFWADPYVLGFAYTLTAHFLQFVFKGNKMSPQKKGDIIVLVFQQLCGQEWAQPLTSANEYALNKNNPEFMRAQNDAATLFGAMHGILNPNDNDPILLSAKKLAVDMSGSGMPNEGALGGAIITLTISKHIKSTFCKS